MSKERLADTEIVSEWLGKNDIQAVLWDLDGTSIKTGKVFTDAMDEYIAFVSKKVTSIPPETMKADIEHIDREAYKTFAVSSKRWTVVVEKAAELYGKEYLPALSEGLPIFMNIYKTIPEPFPLAIETMETFRSATKKMALVTHAEEGWSNIKIDGLNIRRLFDYINIVDATKHKGPDAWQKALDFFEVKAENALVIGDSLSGDIGAAHKIGVKNKIYIPSTWVVYNTGEIPEGTTTIHGIDKIVGELAGQI